jgi:dihydrolipoamide dehydrogenase
VPTWTSDEALSAQERPRSLVVMGGGAVGLRAVPGARALRGRTTLVESGPQVAGKEEPSIAALLAQVLRDDGVDLRLGVEVERAELTADGLARVHLSDGTSVEPSGCWSLSAARPPRTGLGLDVLGIEPGRQGRGAVDDHCRVGGRSTSGRPAT